MIARMNQAQDLAYIYEYGFYIFSRVCTSMTPLLEQRVGVDSLLCNVLKLVLLRLPSGLCGNDIKLTPSFHYSSLNPSLLFPQPQKPLTYQSVPPQDYRFHWILFFWTPGNNIRTGTPTNVKEKARISSTSGAIQCTAHHSHSPGLCFFHAVPSCVDLNSTPTGTAGCGCVV